MDRRHHPRREIGRRLFAAMPGEPERRPEQRLGGGRAEGDDQVRADALDLSLQPGPAREHFDATGLRMDAPFAAPYEFEVLDGVRQVHLRHVDARRFQRLAQYHSGRPDERVALAIFAVARLFADEQQPGARRPLAEHGLGRIPVEVAAPAAGGGRSQVFERATRREEAGRGTGVFGSHADGVPNREVRAPPAANVALVIPLADVSRRPTAFPIVTLSLIIVNVLVFVLELANGDAFVTRWSVIPADVSRGHDLITVVTAMFMHASWAHILGNMVFLWAFGPEIEDAMGPGRYLVYYLLGGIVAMTAQVLADPHSTVPNLGASGAIAAVMGGFLVTYPRDRIRTVLFIWVFVRVTYISAAALIGLWFVYQVLSEFMNLGTVANVQSGGVAYLAHVGGFIFGAVMARLFEDPNRIARQTVYDG